MPIYGQSDEVLSDAKAAAAMVEKSRISKILVYILMYFWYACTALSINTECGGSWPEPKYLCISCI